MEENRSLREQRRSSGKRTREEPLFEPLGYFMIRAPLFPVEAYLQLSSSETEGREELSARNPRARLAIGIGSTSLLEEIERQVSSLRDSRRRDKKLLRYLIRMSTRPTPYGLFAGVALGHWSEQTDLAITDPAARVHAQLDMGWLMPFIWKLEELPEVRRHLRFFANTAVYLRAGRVFLHERATGVSSELRGVSMRATGAVKRALELASQPIAYSDLVTKLLSSLPGATSEKVEQLVSDLWQQTLLLSDLRPPLTGGLHPTYFLQRRLEDIPPTVALAEHLAALHEQMQTWEKVPSEASLAQYRSLIAAINDFTRAFEAAFGSLTDPLPPAHTPGAPTPKRPENRAGELLQVDMGMELAGRALSTRIGADVARMAEVLLRLTVFPHGPIGLSAYRKAFLERYGLNREVPLVELIDQQFGLGMPEMAASSAEEEHYHTERDQILLDLALRAQRTHQRVVELDEQTIQRLQTWTPDPTTVPCSLDLNVFIAAPSPADIDAGRYQLVLGPNVGGQQGGCNFGRFAALLGRECLDALCGTASLLRTRIPAHKLPAEHVYLPHKSRAGNVALRPAVYPYELPYATLPGVAPEQTIPFHELVVGLHGDRFFLRWPRQNVEVLPRAGHMLNPQSAPPLIRLLVNLGLDGIPLIASFHWGNAANAPFLPRVQIDRLVLSLAQWRLSSDARERELPTTDPQTFQMALATWRERWDVPRYVYMSVTDNRLLLDLENEAQSDELRTELHKVQKGSALVLQEVFPTLDQAWVTGPGGHYLTECIVPLIKRPTWVETQAESLPEQPGPREAQPAPDQRLKALGSEWLFMKLYCGKDLQENLVAGPLREFARDALKEGYAQDWFFIRYNDPDPHIRFRFRGEPGVLIGKLLPLLCEWGTWLMTRGTCLKYTFDTYDREIERYGGLEGIALAETLFGADSRAVAELLALLTQTRTIELDKMLLAVYSADDLLASLGVDAPARLRYYRQRVRDRHQAGSSYRQKSAQLRSLLGKPGATLPALPGGSAMLEVLATRRATLVPVAAELGALTSHPSLSRSLAEVYSSYLHMHWNRLLGTDHAAEEEALGLLLRTSESLERAPLPPRQSESQHSGQ